MHIWKVIRTGKNRSHIICYFSFMWPVFLSSGVVLKSIFPAELAPIGVGQGQGLALQSSTQHRHLSYVATMM